MWSRPRNPQRNPNPSARDVSAWYTRAESLRRSLSSASRNRSKSSPSAGEHPGEDHRLGLAVARERSRRRTTVVGDGVADPDQVDLLDPGDEIAHLTGAEPPAGPGCRGEGADLVGGGRLAGGHELDLVAGRHRPVDHPDVAHHPPVGVVVRVEHESPQRAAHLACWGGQPCHDGLQQGVDPFARLGRHPEHLVDGATEDAHDLVGDPVGLGGGQVDLVDHGDDLEPTLDRQVGVGQGLCLDPLGGVHHQERPFGGRQRPGDLVREVDVARGCR